jgi:hypothetical protein
MTDNRGRSALGLCHHKFDVDGMIETFDAATKIRFGWLDLFFNARNSNNALKIIKLPQPKFCRVHIINGPGMNNVRTQPHEITYRETTQSVVKKILNDDKVFIAKFRARARALSDIFAQAPAGTLELAISPWLEHTEIPLKAFVKLAEIILEIIPHALIVDNPRGVIPCFDGYLKEKHGDKPSTRADIVDLDGTDFEMIDVFSLMRRYSKSKAVFLWGLGENGNSRSDTTWLPPEKRTEFTSERELPCYKHFVRPDADQVLNDINPIDFKGVSKRFRARDGTKVDFVWKLGEWKSTAVCLFPRQFRGRFDNVEMRKDGRVIDRARFREIAADGTGRLIYDWNRHPCGYPDNCVIVADGNAWVLDKPKFRID